MWSPLAVGRPKEGVTADVRGERVRIYSDPVLRANVAAKFPAAIPWKPLGLPRGFPAAVVRRPQRFCGGGLPDCCARRRDARRDNCSLHSGRGRKVLIDRPRMIGYNRTVKLRWLDEALDLFLAGMSDADIYEALRERLRDELSVGSTAQRGSREKTITLLMKTWIRVPPPLQELREDGVRLLQGVRRSERLPLHWGMTMAAYPFWRVVADVTGRLFRLQGTAAPMQVQRRVKELLGEREAATRSARYVLRAFVDWA